MLESISIVNLTTYIIIVTLLVISPGADVLLVISASMRNNAKGGIFTAIGVSIGVLLWTVLVAVGLVAVLNTSPPIYNAIVWAGILYMLYVGYGEIKTGLKINVKANGKIAIPATTNTTSNSSFLSKGLITNLLNPKVGIFYLTFLPQFLKNNEVSFQSVMFLGFIHILISLIWLTFCAFFIDFFKQLIKNDRVIKFLPIVSGGLIILFALFIASNRLI